jgi:hypothetical protein
MKCVCGYEKIGNDYVTTTKKVKGKVVESRDYVNVDLEKKPFIKIFGSFHIDKNDVGLFEEHRQEVNIVACPECGTLRMKDDEYNQNI